MGTRTVAGCRSATNRGEGEDYRIRLLQMPNENKIGWQNNVQEPIKVDKKKDAFDLKKEPGIS